MKIQQIYLSLSLDLAQLVIIVLKELLNHLNVLLVLSIHRLVKMLLETVNLVQLDFIVVLLD